MTYTTEELQVRFKNSSLSDAIENLRALKDRRRDFVVPVDRLQMRTDGRVVIHNAALSEFGSDGETIFIMPNDVAHSQIAYRFGIPVRYWRRMLSEHPELAAKNFNGWVNYEAAKEDKMRRMLVRTYSNPVGFGTGTMRALLSDKYMVYENLDLLALALQTVQQANEQHGLDIRVDTCDLTDKKMFVRFVCNNIEAEARTALRNYRDPNNGENGGMGVSNGIVSGFILSNSEVGHGSLVVAPRVTVLACRNGMIWNDEAYKKVHLGAKMEEGEAVWQEDTKRANITLVEKQLRDMITRYISPDFMAQRVADIEAMASQQLSHPIECCGNMCNALGLSEEEQDGILNQFAKQRDVSSVFSVAQAMTSYAHYCEPEKRVYLEQKATELMPLWAKCDTARNN